MSTDHHLGLLVHNELVGLGLETPMVERAPDYLDVNGCKDGPVFTAIRGLQYNIMRELGLDLQDDSLKDTPQRVAKMYCQEIFKGLSYYNFPKCTTVDNKMQYDEMICVDKIEVKSMCEHHFIPFIGYATVAYIPDKKILGLSKFNRIVDFFSRRPQIQERLTAQIAATLSLILGTDDVAVVIRADHMCVKLRGIEDTHTNTKTSKVSGKFRDVPELRAEFLSIMSKGNGNGQ